MDWSKICKLDTSVFPILDKMEEARSEFDQCVAAADIEQAKFWLRRIKELAQQIDSLIVVEKHMQL